MHLMKVKYCFNKKQLEGKISSGGMVSAIYFVLVNYFAKPTGNSSAHLVALFIMSVTAASDSPIS